MAKFEMQWSSSNVYFIPLTSGRETQDLAKPPEDQRAPSHMNEGSNSPGKYPHRLNRDGTIDSICPVCFLTIGTSLWEADLETLEAEHCCEQAWRKEPEDRRGDRRSPDERADDGAADSH